MDTITWNRPTSAVHLEVVQPMQVLEDESNEGEVVAGKVADGEIDENDGSFETISIDSPKIANASSVKEETVRQDPNVGFVSAWFRSNRSDTNCVNSMKGHDVENTARGGEEGEATTEKKSDEQREREKANEVKLYRRLIQILVVVVGLLLIVDLALGILLLLK